MNQEVRLTYGLDEAGLMRHITNVPNGLACNCSCPGCGAPLVAKNQGANVHPHFAHASGTACQFAHESELHLLAKEILVEEQAVMLPAYGNLYAGGLQHFCRMEVEERHECTMLQPDIVGIQRHPVTGEEYRLWIEVRVTHEIGPEKYTKIKELGIACIEIDLSLYRDREVSKEAIRAFLLEDNKYRYWINNPKLEAKLTAQNEQRRAYAERMAQERANSPKPTVAIQKEAFKKKVLKELCGGCPHHTTRESILEEFKIQKFPVEYRNIFLRYPLSFFSSSLVSPLPARPTDYKLTIGNDTLYLATESPDVYGRIINEARLQQNRRAIQFFSHTLPQLVKTLGTKCSHTGRYIPAENGKLYIDCTRN